MYCRLNPIGIGGFVFWGLVFVFTSCAVTVREEKLAPQNITPECWKELGRLKSFSFKLRYHTDVPFKLFAQYSGVWESPDKEAWDGFWVREGEKRSVRLRAKDAVQFFFTDSGWQVHPRGLETKIFSQLEQLLTDGRMDYIGEVKGRFRFRFQPKMSLIDPLRTKVLSGVVEIEKNSGLPVRIYCTDDQRSAEWEALFYTTNRTPRVEIPFVSAMEFQLTAKQSMSCKTRKRIGTALGQRFKQIGIDYRLKWRANRLQVKLNQNLSRTAVELLATRGKIEVWRGRWVGEKGRGSGRVLPVGIDAARQVELQELIGDNHILTSEIDTTIPQQSKLIIQGKFQHQNNSLYVLLVDGQVIATTDIAYTSTSEANENDKGPVNTARLVFSEVGKEEVVRIISALINTTPLPFGMTAVFPQ